MAIVKAGNRRSSASKAATRRSVLNKPGIREKSACARGVNTLIGNTVGKPAPDHSNTGIPTGVEVAQVLGAPCTAAGGKVQTAESMTWSCPGLLARQRPDHTFMMFRRRTTDQVYATLQQVQRRITEQGGGQPSGSGGPNGPAGAPAGARPLSSLAPKPLQTNQGLGVALASGPSNRPAAFPGTQAAENDAAALSSSLGFGGGGPTYPRSTLHVPMHLATVLALLWLTSLVGVYMLGMRQSQRSDPAPANTERTTERATEKSADTKPLDAEGPIPGKRLGDSLYVLKAVPSFNDQMKKLWQAEADRLNGVMQQNASKGWKPYFGVREPENGGLQFVFGYANSVFGVDRVQFEDFSRLLAAPTTKGGGGYTSAKWVALD